MLKNLQISTSKETCAINRTYHHHSQQHARSEERDCRNAYVMFSSWHYKCSLPGLARWWNSSSCCWHINQSKHPVCDIGINGASVPCACRSFLCVPAGTTLLNTFSLAYGFTFGFAIEQSKRVLYRSFQSEGISAGNCDRRTWRIWSASYVCLFLQWLSAWCSATSWKFIRMIPISLPNVKLPGVTNRSETRIPTRATAIDIIRVNYYLTTCPC